MSESTKDTVEGGGNRIVPRATIHKQILDAAESRPEAAMEDIASEINGASIALVERVLEEYGDPAARDSPDSTGEETEGEKQDSRSETEKDESTDDPYDDLLESIDETPLSEKQRKTLRAIFENPDATQRDVADRFGVTAATVSRRVNSIDGFEWSNRERFVERIFGNGDIELMKQERSARATEEFADRIDELAQHVQRLETRLDRPAAQTRTGIEDPELVAKVMHACLHSDQITEDEEIAILENFISNERPNSKRDGDQASN